MNDALIAELPDFDDPLGLLKACHQRMLAHCDMLEKLLTHLADKGVDDETRSAIRRVTTYFSTSAVHHHQDEEEDLFPILARQSLKLADHVNAARQQHQAINAAWETLKEALKNPASLSPEPVERFCALYREHIAYEEKELLFMAQHILSHEQLVELGDRMARRRGVKRRDADQGARTLR